MIIINMPAGEVEHIREDEILWFRKAFKNEWDGATMVQLNGRRIYSSESVKELATKFSAAHVELAVLTPPDTDLIMTVNAEAVRQVRATPPGVYHPNAKSVLFFMNNARLAVAETVEDARKKIEEALRL
ncbi:hypothetical protein [Reyranella soli]|uniref:Uncharacterized protein n=1 Tax=Reyranella soli TaxID=1230389 RepID=A0A512NSN1_9HYPH|nr:hypothetical protein [Reyranella soli]GEP61949.1 hypothetical protein RSO01_91150 [Reyranella soli]